MLNEKMYALGSNRSVIREIFEYSKVRSEQIGAENVFDFSIGNPSIAAPEAVEKTMLHLINNVPSTQLHGYTSAQGDFNVRKTIAQNINSRFNTDITADNLYMTAGAAASLSACITALCQPGDEFVVIAPFFPEYRVFCKAAGAQLVVVPADMQSFQINFEALEQLITSKTKAVIVNSPNNPTGVVLNEETVIRLCNILKEKSQQKGEPIFLIADEPYREVVYNNINVPYLPKYYNNTLVCYSYSKSLSLPGERIGYIVVPNAVTQSQRVYAAVCGAARALGYVCAPSMFQKIVAECCNLTADINAYKTNRDLLYNALTEYGYNCVKPDGAFYLFVKAMCKDANEFCKIAKKYELLLVPSDSFGVEGYVRIAYCVSTEMIKKSLPAFKKLADEFK